jgi:predicted dehydrogenase
VRAAIARGELGASPTVSVDLAWCRDAAYFAAGRATMRGWGCGVLLSVGIHAVDAVCWALGRRVALARGIVGRPNGLEVETRAALHIAFDGGPLASVRATFDAGPDATRIAFAGGGVTAILEGGELDPTGGAVAWVSEDDARIARLRALEADAGRGTAPPLLVPFLADALAALGRGCLPGTCDALPSITDVAGAHRAILDVYAKLDVYTECAEGTSTSMRTRTSA